MLYGLESGLQRRFERHGAYEMFQELKWVFQTHAHVESYETFIAWWQWLKNSVNDTIIQKINSQLSQVVMGTQTFWVCVHWQNYSPLFCSCRTCWRLHISHLGHLLEILTSMCGTSHMLHDIQNIFEVPILSSKAWHAELSSSHQHATSRHSQFL